MKEIGGYLEFERLRGNHYHRGENCLKLNTARNSLVFFLKENNIKKLYIPYYLCDTVALACEKYDINCFFYNIEKDWKVSDNFDLEDDAYIFIVNYYGQLTNDKISVLKNKYNRIIVDNTQAFFQMPFMDVPTIYSCRKFLGVPDGSYLYSNIKSAQILEIDKSSGRMEHILGRFEHNASKYYGSFVNTDKKFIDIGPKRMSEITDNLLRVIDYDYVIKTRNENYNYLNIKLGSSNELQLTVPNGPFMYPYYCENGMEMKRRLAKMKLYIPTLWPDISDEIDDDALERDLTDNILPLPCDQRYTIEDMAEIIERIESV